ncbi:MAG: 50S ribosomal protein L3 [Firmicutes bacterium]|nr:50S ribosomal protein L3 [Bacillota bacterium]
MNKAIIGKKLGMSHVFMADGTMIPVTVIKAGPCPVVQKKTADSDGYFAVQLGFEDIREKLVTKPRQGHFKKANVKPLRVLKEFKLKNTDTLNIGDIVKCTVFAENDIVDVSGITQGRGFAGQIERHNSHRMFETHGTGPCVRQSGSMGSNSSPSRVFPGREMPGHLGCENVTVQNLKVIKIDEARDILMIKGAIPGVKGSIVTVKSAVRTQKAPSTRVSTSKKQKK